METKVFNFVILGIFAAISVGLLSIAWNFITASGKVDYCYIRQAQCKDGVCDELRGNIEWRLDESISFWETSDAARTEAKLLNCPIQP